MKSLLCFIKFALVVVLFSSGLGAIVLMLMMDRSIPQEVIIASVLILSLLGSIVVGSAVLEFKHENLNRAVI
ncbi:hypothetical protein [Thiomicrospira sp.]|uniref:hypothetical protein n=1 Tax=Thiomicrospira sp. TaxID=935 RepID=UPI002F953943